MSERTRRNGQWIRGRALIGMLLAAAVPAMLVAGTAWACAPSQGTISFNSLEYYPGDEVIVSGRNFPRDTTLELTLQSPSGSTTTVGNGVRTGDDSTFRDSFSLSSSAEVGDYVVIARTDSMSSRATFKVVPQPAIGFNALEHYSGGEVIVSGSNFPMDSPVELTLRSPSGAITRVGNSISTDGVGSFQNSFSLSSSAEPGQYVVSAKAGATSSRATFSVVERPVSESEPAPPQPAPPQPAPPQPAPPQPAPPQPAPIPGVVGVVFPAKLELERAQVMRRDRRLDVLAPITGRASGEVGVEFFAAQRRHKFTEVVDSENRRVRFDRAIPAEQARLGTGIMTITYPGDEDTRPQEVRLRAASQPANLELERPRIDDGHLKAQGTISDRAQGIVRLQLQYVVDGQTETVKLRGRIDDGRWEIDEALSKDVRDGIAGRTGAVHSYTLFTGYFERRIRGEMQAFQILGDR
jgi:subtilisin-like proprotein convertase family protein